MLLRARFFKSKGRTTILGLAVSATLLAWNAQLVHASIIISDAFSGTNGAAINSRTPDGADLPGSKYVSNTYVSATMISISAGNSAPAFASGANGEASISIASAGTYVKPTQFIISGDLSVNTIQGSAGNQGRGVGLGFYSVAPNGQEANTNFTGLTFSSNGNGTVGVLEMVAGGSQVGSQINILNGNLNTASFYNLTYTIDTTTGSISNVSFNGSAVVGLPSTTGFTDAATTLAGFYGSSVASGSIGYVDNFSVSTVPEPASIAVSAVAAGLMMARRHRGH